MLWVLVSSWFIFSVFLCFVLCLGVLLVVLYACFDFCWLLFRVLVLCGCGVVARGLSVCRVGFSFLVSICWCLFGGLAVVVCFLVVFYLVIVSVLFCGGLGRICFVYGVFGFGSWCWLDVMGVGFVVVHL